jgi:hypothetical protein
MMPCGITPRAPHAGHVARTHQAICSRRCSHRPLPHGQDYHQSRALPVVLVFTCFNSRGLAVVDGISIPSAPGMPASPPSDTNDAYIRRRIHGRVATITAKSLHARALGPITNHRVEHGDSASLRSTASILLTMAANEHCSREPSSHWTSHFRGIQRYGQRASVASEQS